MNKTPGAKAPFFSPGMVLPFILLAVCFASWGLAQDLTTPLVSAFKGVFTMTTFEASLVQFAFYGAYFLLALPTGFINRRWGYKVGVLTGLGLAAIGALGFIPAAQSLTFFAFLIALFVLAAGLSILETSASPFVVAMGPEASGTRRLNLAQAFNPIGTNLGVLMAAILILPRLNPATEAEKAAMSRPELLEIQQGDLFTIMGPYVALAGLLIVVWVGIAIVKVPGLRGDTKEERGQGKFSDAARRLVGNSHYRYGVLAQFAYVGAQVCTWTYIVIYVENLVPGGTAVDGAWFLQAALIVYLVMRFLMTWIMGFVRPTKLMAGLAALAVALCAYAALFPGIGGAWALVGVSGCMSLMFPTIYGVALYGLKADTKFGASGLVMAIVGGAIMPPIQGYLTDVIGSALALIVPAVCFVGVLAYAIYDVRSKRDTSGSEDESSAATVAVPAAGDPR